MAYFSESTVVADIDLLEDSGSAKKLISVARAPKEAIEPVITAIAYVRLTNLDHKLISWYRLD